MCLCVDGDLLSLLRTSSERRRRRSSLMIPCSDALVSAKVFSNVMALFVHRRRRTFIPTLLTASCLFIGYVESTANNSSSCNRTTLDQCMRAIEPLLNSPSMAKGIPSSQEAVQARCQVFKTGMSCIDKYKDGCLNQRQKLQMERAVAGAQHTFAFLCDDPVFQSEFLQHQSCLRGTSDDWERCAYHFQGMVAEEMAAVNISRADRNLGLCCAKHGFLRCVYYAAQFKCRKDAALFLMRVAQTLTESQVHEGACKRIKFDEVCTSDSSVTTAASSILTYLVLAIAVITFPRWQS